MTSRLYRKFCFLNFLWPFFLLGGVAIRIPAYDAGARGFDSQQGNLFAEVIFVILDCFFLFITRSETRSPSRILLRGSKYSKNKNKNIYEGRYFENIFAHIEYVLAYMKGASSFHHQLNPAYLTLPTCFFLYRHVAPLSRPTH